MSIKVLNVFGMSYSGSTLLNFMLDCVPDVYGGGELHWLLTQHEQSQSYKAHCTQCKQHCPIWTPQQTQNAPTQGLYKWIAELTEQSVIVDTSKMVSWFMQREKIREKGVSHFNYLLVKHPLRHICSLMVNANIGREDISTHSIDNAISTFSNYYKEVLSFLRERHYMVIHYENLIADNVVTINRILRPVGVQHTLTTLDCFASPHHQIGGNAGAIYMATNEWPVDKQEVPNVRLNQYESQKGVVIDNKYKTYFSDEHINYILRNNRISMLHDQLNFCLD